MLNSKTLRVFGYSALVFSAVLLVLIFLVPYWILNGIMGNLKEKFQLSQENRNIWEKIYDNKTITYRKTLKFFNLENNQYFELAGATLQSSPDLIFNKSMELQDIKFVGDRIKANLEERLTILPDYESDYYSRSIFQFRPGALRAVSELERRPPS